MGAFDVRMYLQGLRGQTLMTVTGKPNRVVDVRGDSAIVATEQNEAGAPIPISLVQGVVDRVYDGEEVELDPRRRSAFVGAVLLTVPDIEVLLNPRRARLIGALPSTSYMYGWDRRWRDYEADGMAGEPLVHAASNNFERMHVKVGDRVYVVANRDGRMILIGRLTVDHVVDRHEAEYRLGRDVIDRRSHVLTDAPDSIVRFDREVPEAVARGLRSRNGAAVAFASDTEYKLASQALTPMLRLTEDSATDLDALLATTAEGGDGPRRRSLTTAAINSAIERYAVRVVSDHLRADGWEVDDVGLVESYDLDCVRGKDTLHVEVKGTTGTGDPVTLTHREVDHARNQHPHVALGVVSGIRVTMLDNGLPDAAGGSLELWHPWRIDDGEIKATVFRYSPPR